MKMSPEFLEILLRLEKEKVAQFSDSVHYTLSEAADYLVKFKNLKPEEAENIVKKRNFCDLSNMLILKKGGYVKELDSESFDLNFELSSFGIQYLRDYKIKNIMND